MKKCCTTALGIGIGAAIIGMHLYMFMEPEDQIDIKGEFKDVIDELKKATSKLTELGWEGGKL